MAGLTVANWIANKCTHWKSLPSIAMPSDRQVNGFTINHSVIMETFDAIRSTNYTWSHSVIVATPTQRQIVPISIGLAGSSLTTTLTLSAILSSSSSSLWYAEVFFNVCIICLCWSSSSDVLLVRASSGLWLKERRKRPASGWHRKKFELPAAGNVEFKLGVEMLVSLRRKLCDRIVVTVEPVLMLLFIASLMLFTASLCSAPDLKENNVLLKF